ncbi:MAG: hypothetical protein AB198_00400 [Parcubacteria bacterium C7867-003]|nr:MAG: hypothetical protein AB198_00400 [Parcubacteria bacterium C7867-003]
MNYVRLLIALFGIFFFGLFGVQREVRADEVIGNYRGAEVRLYEMWNARSQSYDYMVLVVPNKGRSKYPVVAMNNPYMIMHGAWSRNEVDKFWTSIAHTPGVKYDVSLPQQNRIYQCFSPTGECPVVALGPALMTDVRSLANLFGEVGGRPLFEQLLDDGYAIAVIMNVSYQARDVVSLFIGVRNALFRLKSLPMIDANRVGIMGGSQGGTLSVLPLAFPSEDLHLAASVSLFGASNLKEHFDYNMGVEALQPSHLWRETWNFFAPGLNRVIPAFGMDRNGPLWQFTKFDSIASRFHTPLLMLHGTDDCMVNVDQTTGQFDALRNYGRITNKWVWENGPAPLATVSIPACGHGTTDRNWQVKSQVLTGNFFLTYMPPDQTVIRRVPEDVNLLEMFYDFAESYEGAGTRERENILGLIAQASNPKIQYVSSDPLVPSGRGDQVGAVVKEYTFANWKNRGGVVTVLVPQDLNLLDAFYGYADAYFRPGVTPTEQARILGLVNERANPRIIYRSNDPRVPSGTGDVVVPQVVNYVIATYNNRLTTVRVPQDLNLLDAFYSYADAYFRPGVTPTEQARILGQVNEKANPRIMYVSSDPRIPTGTGDVVVPQVVNYVIATWQNRLR